MTLGNKIQELRKSQLLSQESFAETMKVTRQSVSKWELDQSYPSIDKLVEIADFFNVSLDEMLRNEVDPSRTINPIIDKDMDKDGSRKFEISKGQLLYFTSWAIMVIIMLILFGIKEYIAGFLISQIFIWTTVIIRIYNYVKTKKIHLE